MAQKSKERQNKSWEIYASDSDEDDELEKPVLKKFKKVYNSKFENYTIIHKFKKLNCCLKITGCRERVGKEFFVKDSS